MTKDRDTKEKVRREFEPRRTISLPLFSSVEDYARFRRMIYKLFSLEQELSSIRSIVADHFGLGLSQHMILTAIGNLQGTRGVTVMDVATYMHVSTPFIAAETGKLAKMGLLKKTPDTQDRRRTLLLLCSKGEEYVNDVADYIRDVNDQIFGPLDETTFQVFEQVLSGLADTAVLATENLKHKMRVISTQAVKIDE